MSKIKLLDISDFCYEFDKFGKKNIVFEGDLNSIN